MKHVTEELRKPAPRHPAINQSFGSASKNVGRIRILNPHNICSLQILLPYQFCKVKTSRIIINIIFLYEFLSCNIKRYERAVILTGP